MSFDVFFSYARKDAVDIISQVYDQATANGISVWWDVKEMTQRELAFTEEIGKIIKQTKRMVLFVGPNMQKSEYVEAEWRYARICGVKVYPVIIGYEENAADGYELVPRRLKKMHARDIVDVGKRENEIAKLIEDLKTELNPLAPLMNVPALPNGYVERNDYLDDLFDYYFGQNPENIGELRFGAVTGMGGSGKSTIASALCHDEVIRRQFNRIIWIKIGDESSLTDIWHQIAIQCSLPKDLSELEMKIELSKKYASDNCLFVLDNCNDPLIIEFFKNALDTSRNRVLLTTRDSVICNSFGIKTVRVGDLSVKEARRMIAKCCGMTETELGNSADKLIEAVGGHSFAIAIGATMYMEMLDWDLVVETYYEAETVLDLTIPNYEYKNVFASLEASVKTLSSEMAKLFIMLSVFKKESVIPIKKIALLWSDDMQMTNKPASVVEMKALLLLKKLASRSLLSIMNNGSDVILHNLVFDYIEQKQDNTIYHKAFAEKISVEKDYYYYDNIIYHLINADEKAEARNTLFSVEYQVEKAKTCGIYKLIKDCDYWENDAAVGKLRMFYKISRHILKDDINQIAAQLYGRFDYPDGDAEISTLMEQALKYTQKPFLCPEEVCMMPIGRGIDDIVTCSDVLFSVRSINGKLVISDKAGLTTVLNPETFLEEKMLRHNGWCLDSFYYGEFIVSIYNKKQISFFNVDSEETSEIEAKGLISSWTIEDEKLYIGDVLGNIYVFCKNNLSKRLKVSTGVSFIYSENGQIYIYGINCEIRSLSDISKVISTTEERIIKKQGNGELTIKGRLFVGGKPINDSEIINDFDQDVYINKKGELVLFDVSNGKQIRRIRTSLDLRTVCKLDRYVFVSDGNRNIYKLDIQYFNIDNDVSKSWINSLCAFKDDLYYICQNGMLYKNNEKIADMHHWYNVLTVTENYLLLADNIGEISLYDRETLSRIETIEHKSKITGMVYRKGLLYVSDALGIVTIWRIQDKTVVNSYKIGSWITSMTCLEDILICSDRYGHLFEYEADGMTIIRTLNMNNEILAVSNYNGAIAVATQNDKITLIDSVSGEEKCRYYPSISEVTAVYSHKNVLYVCTETNMQKLYLAE